MATHSSVLAWRIPGTGEPDGLPSMWSHSLKRLSSSRTIQSMRFSNQNTGVGGLSVVQGNLPNPGIEPKLPTFQAYSLPAESRGKQNVTKLNVTKQ